MTLYETAVKVWQELYSMPNTCRISEFNLMHNAGLGDYDLLDQAIQYLREELELEIESKIWDGELYFRCMGV